MCTAGNSIAVTLANLGTADADAASVVINIWVNGRLVIAYNASTLADQDFLVVGGSSVLESNSLRKAATVAVCINNPHVVLEFNYHNNCTAAYLEP